MVIEHVISPENHGNQFSASGKGNPPLGCVKSPAGVTSLQKITPAGPYPHEKGRLASKKLAIHSRSSRPSAYTTRKSANWMAANQEHETMALYDRAQPR